MFTQQFISKRRDQYSHDKMVRSLVNELNSKMFKNIKADIDNYPKPNQINGFIPDVTATDIFIDYVFEVETLDTIDIEHTRQQFVAFDKYARSGVNRRFIVGVPSGCEYKAQQVLRGLNINAEVRTLS